MSKNINVRAPELKERVLALADRLEMTQGEVVRMLLEPQVERVEREWARIERQINQVPTMTTDKLEDEEDRLFNLRRKSDAEEAYLDAVQEELRKRSQPAAA